jgi:hypothetical protein
MMKHKRRMRGRRRGRMEENTKKTLAYLPFIPP